MTTIVLKNPEEAAALRALLTRLIDAPAMLDKREVTPTYNEVMAMIEVCNQLSAQL